MLCILDTHTCNELQLDLQYIPILIISIRELYNSVEYVYQELTGTTMNGKDCASAFQLSSQVKENIKLHADKHVSIMLTNHSLNF